MYYQQDAQQRSSSSGQDKQSNQSALARAGRNVLLKDTIDYEKPALLNNTSTIDDMRKTAASFRQTTAAKPLQSDDNKSNLSYVKPQNNTFNNTQTLQSVPSATLQTLSSSIPDASAAKILQQAKLNIERQNFQPAQVLLDDFIVKSSNPFDRSQAYNLYGHLFLAQKNSDKARESFNLSKQQNAKNADSLLNFGILLLQHKSTASQGIQNLQESLQLNEDSITSSEAAFQIGKYYYIHKNLTKADIFLTRCTVINPNHIMGLRLLSCVCTSLKRIPQAQQLLLAAIAIRPTDKDFYNLGLLYLEASLLNEAEQYFNKCVAVNPQHDRAYSNLGILAFMRKDLETAKQNYEKAIEVNPQCLEALNNLANLYYSSGDSTTAESLYKRAVASEDVDDAHLLFNNAQAQIALNYWDAAIIGLTKCVQLDNQLYYAYKLLAHAYTNKSLYMKASEALSKYTETEQNDADAYFLLAQSQFKTFLVSKAKESLDRCLAIQPNHPQAVQLLQEINARKATTTQSRYIS